MKTSTLQNRLSIIAFIVVIVTVFSLVLFPGSSSMELSSAEGDGVVSQVESILATSARHVFDEDYWIANMHSIRSSQF